MHQPSPSDNEFNRNEEDDDESLDETNTPT
jgi:hypothetical protein